MIKNKKIAILGCGWLGLPLAKRLIENNASINGSTTQPEKLDEIKSIGGNPFLINLEPVLNDDLDPSFFDVDILISCFPPRRREDISKYYPQQVANLIKQIKQSSIKQVLFVSSTSVYPNTQTILSEKDQFEPDKESGKALVAAERLLQNESKFATTIVRFGGLIGYDRHPGRFLSGKRNLKNGDVPVNLIHQDDCINILKGIIENGLWNECYNACSPEHPTRKEFYQTAAKLGGFPEPKFEKNPDPRYKIISSEKITKALSYDFKYSNPINTI